MSNRNFKFRAWDTKNNNFVGNSCRFLIDSEGRLMEFVQSDGFTSGTKLDGTWCRSGSIESRSNFVIQLYTGVKDKNNIDIYEGDIITVTDGQGRCDAIVNYSEEHAAFRYNKSCFNQPGYNTGKEEYEIIGNIFENSNPIKE